MTVRAVIFDWYGTLVQPMPDDWWPRVPELIVHAGGTVPPAALERWVHSPIEHLEHSRSKGHYDAWTGARLQELLGACGLEERARRELTAQIEQASKEEIVSLASGAVTVLDELQRRGFKLAVCSNWEWDLDRQLHGNAISDRFDAVICSARVGYRKPHAQIFDLVLDALDLPPHDTLFVGDDWNADIEGASAAGISVVHAAWAIPCAESTHRTVRCCPAIEALLDLPELAG